jgi:hypothetical protein
MESAENKRKIEQYNRYRDQLLTARQLNFQQLDKAIFTLSGGGLGLSIAFVKDIFHIKQAVLLWFLFSSWFLFIASIILTLVSFLFSWLATDKQLNIAHEYYIEKKEESLNKKNNASIVTSLLNIFAVVCFVSAAILTVCFVYKNLLKERNMNKNNGVNVTQAFRGLGGYVPPMMQKSNGTEIEKRGFVPSKIPKDPGKSNTDQGKKQKPKTNNLAQNSSSDSTIDNSGGSLSIIS